MKSPSLQNQTRRHFVNGGLALVAANLALGLHGEGAEKAVVDAPRKASPNEALMEEHGLLNRVLIIYEESIRRLTAGEEMPPGPLLEAAKIVRKYEYRTDNPPVGDPGFKVRVTTTLQPDAEGALVTLNHAGEPIGSATVSGGFALITPTKRTDSASLTVTLEDDGFERTTMPVSAPVPRLTAACSASTNIRGGHNVQVTGTVAPSVSGATVRLKMTKANGVIVTGSALTNSSSAYAVKLPLLDSDVGVMNVGVFYDGERKYGATDVSCAVTA